MGLLIKLSIEETNELNVVIWNDSTTHIKLIGDISNPVANLKIPLNENLIEEPLKEIQRKITVQGPAPKQQQKKAEDMNCIGRKIIETSGRKFNAGNNQEFEKDEDKDSNEVEHKVAVASNIVENQEPLAVNPAHMMVVDLTDDDAKGPEVQEDGQNKGGEEMVSKTLGDRLPINNFLSYLKKKCGVIGTKKQECHCQKPEINSSVMDNSMAETSLENESSQSPNTGPSISLDVISIASDDFSLMIDDEPSKVDPISVPNNMETSPTKVKLRRSETFNTTASPLYKNKRSEMRCRICDRVFNRSSNYKSHMVTFHKLNFTCPICDSSFALRTQFSTHLRSHCIQKRNTSIVKKKFYCKNCGKYFKSNEMLIKHLKEHVQAPSRWFYKVSKFNMQSKKL